MSPTSEQAAIGRRMKAAAVQAQLGAYEIARRLGVKAATVYRWWYGERTPSSEMMLAYAAELAEQCNTESTDTGTQRAFDVVAGDDL